MTDFTAPEPKRTGQSVLLLVAVLLLTAGTFARIVVEGGFVYDDLSLVVTNPQVREDFSLIETFKPPFWEVAYPLTGGRIPFYRPLVMTTFHLGWRLSGVEAWGHHAINLLVHLLATAAVFQLLRHYVRGSLVVAGVGALLFGLHPVHVESVAWVSGISDVLATTFILWAWVFVLRGLRTGSLLAFSLGLLLHLGGLFSKEVAMFFAPSFVLALLLLGPWDRARRHKIALGAALVLPLVAWYGARVLVFDSWSAGVERTVVPLLDHTEPWRAFAIRPEFVGHYFLLLLDPSSLSPFHVFRPQIPLNDPTLLLHMGLGVGVFLLALLFVLFREHRGRAYTLGTWVFLIGLVPVLLKPSVLGQFPVSERYLYFSSFGFVLAFSNLLAIVLAKLGRVPRATLLALVVAATLGLGWVAYRNSLSYRTEHTFFTNALERSPHCAVAQVGMGRVLVEQAERSPGLDLEARRQKLIAAEGHFERVAGDREQRIDDQRYFVAFFERATAYLWQVQSATLAAEFVPPAEKQSQLRIAEAYAQRYRELLDDLEKAVVKENPEYIEIVQAARQAPEYLLAQARIEFGLDRHQRAIELCREALRVQDNNVEACTTLARFHELRARELQDPGERLRLHTSAIAHLERALQIDPRRIDIQVQLARHLVHSARSREQTAPGDEEAITRGVREIERAASLLDEVLRENPRNAVALWELGELFAQRAANSEGEERQRYLIEAYRLMSVAIEASGGNPRWVQQLATMYMASRHFFEAQNLVYRYLPQHADDLGMRATLVEILVRAWATGNAQPEVRRQAEAEIANLRELDAKSWLADAWTARLIGGTDVPRMLDAWRRALNLAASDPRHPELVPDLRREAARWFIHVARETQKLAIQNASRLSPEEFSRQIDSAARLYEEGALLVHRDPKVDLDWLELANLLLQASRPEDAEIILERAIERERDEDRLARMRELLEEAKKRGS